MNISSQNFVTVDEILSDAIKLVDDLDYRFNSRGYYISQIQQALEELSFDTFFMENNFSCKVPEDLRLDMPSDAFNLRQLYLYNGDECNIEKAAVVYHKKNFINAKSGNGYVARDTYRNERDPFHKRRGVHTRTTKGNLRTGFKHTDNVLYFGMQNGLIMLSESCRNFENVMMVYNSTGVEIGEAPIIPTYLRQAVKDYVVVKTIEARMASDSENFNKWTYLYNLHNTNLTKPYEGSWAKAENRVKQLDYKQRQDMKEYFSKLNY